MADRKPPRFDGGEAETLVGLLAFQRESVIGKLDGLSDEQLTARLVPSETTLAWIIGHLADAERNWVLARFAGRAPGDSRTAAATAADEVERYRSVSRDVDEIVMACPDLSTRCADSDYSDLPLRWVVAHLLEETARHAGHADILRELLDGATGR
jgi:uncharacterized protein DUF664